MRTWFTRAATALTASMVMTALGTGGGRAVRHADAQPDPARVADRDAAREQAKQKIRALRAAILIEGLGLDEATATRLGPILARHDDELERLQAERRALRKAVHDALAANDDQKLNGLIDQLVANQRARWDRELTRVAELRTLLSPRQAARLLDILPRIDRRILQGLRRAVAGPGADDDEGDDDVGPPPPRLRRPHRRP